MVVFNLLCLWKCSVRDVDGIGSLRKVLSGRKRKCFKVSETSGKTTSLMTRSLLLCGTGSLIFEQD